MESSLYKNVSDNVGTTNLIDTETYKSLAIECCNTIIDLLLNHCGRFAYNSLLIQQDKHSDPTSPFKNVFTKDGISIIKHLNFYNPVQNHIKDMVAYIGDRVDRMSYDGTTTSMLIFAMLLRRYYQEKKITHDMVDTLINTIDFILVILETNKVTIEDLVLDFDVTKEEALRFVVYTEAMIASKDDAELAEALTTIITTLPPELYSQFTFYQSEIESKDRFTIIDEDYDFQIDASFIMPDLYNSNIGTEYINEDCNLLVVSDSLTRGHPFLPILEESLLATLNAVDEERVDYRYITEKDIVIVSQEFAPSLLDLIRKYNIFNTNKIVPIQIIGSANQKDIRLDVVTALASVYSVTDILSMRENWYEKAFIQNASISYKHRLLDFKNLYPKDPTHTYTPNYLKHHTQEAFPPYDALYDEITFFLDKHTKKHVKLSNNQEIYNLKQYTKIYQKMICSKVVSLQISGSTHDSLADFSVVQDAFGAICATLEKGFIFDGFWTVYENVDNNLIFSSVLNDIFKQMSGKNYKDLASNKHNKYHYSYIDIDKNVFTSRLNQSNVLQPVTSSVLIQPAAGFTELFSRMKELLPKLLLTTDVIVPNVVNTRTIDIKE